MHAAPNIVLPPSWCSDGVYGSKPKHVRLTFIDSQIGAAKLTNLTYGFSKHAGPGGKIGQTVAAFGVDLSSKMRAYGVQLCHDDVMCIGEFSAVCMSSSDRA